VGRFGWLDSADWVTIATAAALGVCKMFHGCRVC
jgi:hypothetical protein